MPHIPSYAKRPVPPDMGLKSNSHNAEHIKKVGGTTDCHAAEVKGKGKLYSSDTGYHEEAKAADATTAY